MSLTEIAEQRSVGYAHNPNQEKQEMLYCLQIKHSQESFGQRTCCQVENLKSGKAGNALLLANKAQPRKLRPTHVLPGRKSWYFSKIFAKSSAALTTAATQ
jgi:hypothetical protein